MKGLGFKECLSCLHAQTMGVILLVTGIRLVLKICIRGSCSEGLLHAVLVAPVLPPSPFSGHTYVWTMNDGLTHFAPILTAYRRIGKALDVDTGFHLQPVLRAIICCFLAEVLIVYHPWWPAVFQAYFCYGWHVCQQRLDPIRLVLHYNCHIKAE